MPYRFKLPIGDWSGGRTGCDWFDCVSDKSIVEIREVFFQLQEKLGVSPDHFLCHYGVNTPERMEFKQFREYMPVVPDPDHRGDFNKELKYWQEMGVCSDDFAQLVVNMLNKADPTLNITFEEEVIPMLPFYGYDDQDRHISFLGTGCIS